MPSLDQMLVVITMVFGLFSTLVNGSDSKVSLSSKTSGFEKTRRLQTLTSLNKAVVGSKTFAWVDNYDCNNDMVKTVRKFFKANDDMFNRCIADSGYKLYPYSGILPDATIVTGLVTSEACMSIITAVVLLHMPSCTLDNLEMRAACETVLYYSTALKHGFDAPTSEQFYELMTWRNHVNLAKASGKPYDGTSKAYSEFTEYMGDAISSSKVTVMDDFTVISGTEQGNAHLMNDSIQPSFNFTSPTINLLVGRVSNAEVAHDDVTLTTKSETAISLDVNDATALIAPVVTLIPMLILLLV
ncbi:putative elicitin [Plasmopara halstedii]